MTPKLKSRLLAAATLAVFAFAIWVLKGALANVVWADVRAYLAALPPLRIAAAAGFAAASYFWLTWYDTLAIRFVSGKQFSWLTIAPTSFVAYAVGHNVGVSTISGGAIRLRDYSRLGLSGAQVAGVITLCVFALGLGANLLLDYALFMHTGTASTVLHVSTTSVQLIGVANLCLFAAYLWFTASRQGRPFTIGENSIAAPPLAFTLRQTLVSMADLSCSAAAFYCLLPVDGLSYLPFLGFYVLAMIAGVVSNVPGGLGVFESVMLLTIPEAQPAQLAGSALAFRAVYYLVPFALALLLLLVKEGRRFLQRKQECRPADTSVNRV